MTEWLGWAGTQTILTPFIWRWIRDWQAAKDPRMRPTPLLVGLVRSVVIGVNRQDLWATRTQDRQGL